MYSSIIDLSKVHLKYTYILDSLRGLILRILLKITSLSNFPRIGWMVNGMKVLLSGHLKRILPALVHNGIDDDIVPTVRRVSGDALSSVKGLCSVILLDLVYEMKLLRVSSRLLVLLKPLGSGFALCAFFARSDSWLSWDRMGHRVLQACVLDTRMM